MSAGLGGGFTRQNVSIFQPRQSTPRVSSALEIEETVALQERDTRDGISNPSDRSVTAVAAARATATKIGFR